LFEIVFAFSFQLHVYKLALKYRPSDFNILFTKSLLIQIFIFKPTDTCFYLI